MDISPKASVDQEDAKWWEGSKRATTNMARNHDIEAFWGEAQAARPGLSTASLARIAARDNRVQGRSSNLSLGHGRLEGHSAYKDDFCAVPAAGAADAEMRPQGDRAWKESMLQAAWNKRVGRASSVSLVQQ